MPSPSTGAILSGLGLLALLSLAAPGTAAAQASPAPALSPAPAVSPAPAIPPAAQAPAAGQRFDPVAATDAYLATLSQAQRSRSDAYFEGGYWLILWGFLYGLGVAWLLLGSRLSARMRDFAERATRFRPLQTILYALQYILATTVLSFPLAVYTDFFREHQYGLATQSFAAWMGDQLKGLGIGLVIGSLVLAALYGVLRRAPRTWWLWGAIVSILFATAGIALAPVFIEPIFNQYTELRDPAVREPILSLARANGIPAEHVYVVDASRQTNRVSANVAGALGTTRIALNDNLLRRVSLPGIKAVMGHEMGHYVLNHVYQGVFFFGVVLVAGFAFLRWGFDRAVARWGGNWGVRGVSDPAGLPLLAALFSIFLFVLTPLNNTFIRTSETEADIFGLNAAREPAGMAEVSLKLSEYRKLAPGP
ncbi:MAG TPA: M48 family metallopeptidase, partial [Thermoanaerobaculia bacterium]